MMKSSGWIDFQYKLPYITVYGGDAPYDYLILVAIRDTHDALDIEDIVSLPAGGYRYALLTASRATHIYMTNATAHRLFTAWTSFDGCTVIPR